MGAGALPLPTVCREAAICPSITPLRELTGKQGRRGGKYGEFLFHRNFTKEFAKMYLEILLILCKIL
jgi:hypothetical protein